jgi:hypothetical protein
MEINRQAPACAAAQTYIEAPVALVWSIQTDLEGWPDWNPDVGSMDLRGPISPGTEFRWKAGGLPIVSKFEEVDRPQRIVWTGRTLGIRAIHVWRFEERASGVAVQTEESFDGPVARLFARTMRRTLATSLEKWLAALKAECERRSGVAAAG